MSIQISNYMEMENLKVNNFPASVASSIDGAVMTTNPGSGFSNLSLSLSLSYMCLDLSPSFCEARKCTSLQLKTKQHSFGVRQ